MRLFPYVNTGFFVFCLSLNLARTSFAEDRSCEDVQFQDQFKQELNLEKLKEECSLSNLAVKYGKVMVEIEKGKREKFSCCEAVRKEMHKSVKAQQDLKKQLCEDIKVKAAKVSCGGSAECLQRNISLMKSSSAMYSKLKMSARDAAMKVKSVVGKCSPLMRTVRAQVKRDIAAIKAAKARAVAQSREIDSSTTLGGR